MQYAVNATCIAAEDGVMLVNSWRKQSWQIDNASSQRWFLVMNFTHWALMWIVNTVAQDGLPTTEQFSEKTVDKLIRWWSHVMNFKHSPKPSLVHFAQIEMNVELWSIFPQINNYINKLQVLITDHNLFEYSVVQLKRCHNICCRICSTFLSQPCFSRSRGGSSVWATCRSWDSRSGRMNRNSRNLS